MPNDPRRTEKGPHPTHPSPGRREDALAPSPGGCTPQLSCGVHDTRHVHGGSCGHPALDHGDHVDFEVEGHRHHPHGDHCDDHGPATM